VRFELQPRHRRVAPGRWERDPWPRERAQRQNPVGSIHQRHCWLVQRGRQREEPRARHGIHPESHRANRARAAIPDALRHLGRHAPRVQITEQRGQHCMGGLRPCSRQKGPEIAAAGTCPRRSETPPPLRQPNGTRRGLGRDRQARSVGSCHVGKMGLSTPPVPRTLRGSAGCSGAARLRGARQECSLRWLHVHRE